MLAFLQTDLIPKIPLEQWANKAITWIIEHFGGFFEILKGVIEGIVGIMQFVLTAPPALLMVAILAVIAYFLSGWRMALFTVIGLLFVISLGLWGDAMLTLALILVAATISLVIGIPIGIIAAKSRGLEEAIRPVLDLMQTMPAFVYLVPFVILLGLGAGPALIATVIFATPPAVRLTMLGIQQVPKDTVEAAHAFRATPWQTLFKVELPLSLNSIGAGGLGEPVVSGLQTLNIGQSFIGGIGIVVLAIILDRITRGIGGGRARKA